MRACEITCGHRYQHAGWTARRTVQDLRRRGRSSGWSASPSAAWPPCPVTTGPAFGRPTWWRADDAAGVDARAGEGYPRWRHGWRSRIL